MYPTIATKAKNAKTFNLKMPRLILIWLEIFTFFYFTQFSFTVKAKKTVEWTCPEMVFNNKKGKRSSNDSENEYLICFVEQDL